MTETARDLVIAMTRGTDHELSSVPFTIANGGLTAGLKVYAFLTTAAVDLVRNRAIDLTHAPPLDPLGALVADFLKRGGVIWPARRVSRLVATRKTILSRASQYRAQAQCTR
jgi:predicted peroxiredoxin